MVVVVGHQRLKDLAQADTILELRAMSPMLITKLKLSHGQFVALFFRMTQRRKVVVQPLRCAPETPEALTSLLLASA